MGAKGQWERVEPVSKPLHFTSTGFILHFGKGHPSHLHLLDGPIVCILPSQQEHTKCILQTTLTLVQMYSFIYFFKDKKMTIRLN